LPKPVENSDILSFLSRVFDAQSDVAWLARIDRARFGQFLILVLPPKEQLIEALAPQFFMSLEILSLRLAGLGYDPVITQRLKSRREYQSAFMDVPRNVHALLDVKGEDAIPSIREALRRCSSAMVWVRSRRGVDGVSLAMTYHVMKIQQVVQRVELLLELTEATLGTWKPQPALDLFFEVLQAELGRFNIRRFLGENLELLAFQITEHTGKTGEHYITRGRREWKLMFRSAAIGGAIVGVLAPIKIVISHWHLPLAIEALSYSLLYSVGFLAIHSVGGTLATKQPAMTASTLAASLDEATSSEQAMDQLADVIVCTIRTQLVALAGNFLVAFPVAVLLTLPFTLIHFPLMNHEKALSVIASLHPFKSLSFFYAAVAGVGLCLAGLLAGFADNWFVFNHVGSRLINSPVLRRFVSEHNLDRSIHTIDHNLGLWVGNVALGFYLGSITSLGTIFGLPIDIRHITFSSAQFGSALATLNFEQPWPMIVIITLSVMVMGLINLLVSFSLTLFLVVKSRKIRFAQTPELVRRLRARLRRNPFEFLYPSQDLG
jgi:site-specific recombinase